MVICHNFSEIPHGCCWDCWKRTDYLPTGESSAGIHTYRITTQIPGRAFLKKMEQIKFELVLRHANGLYFHFTTVCKNFNICIVYYLHSIWLHLLQGLFICRSFSLKCILNAMSDWYNCSFTAPCCQHIPRQEEHWGSHWVCSGQHWGTSSHTLC